MPWKQKPFGWGNSLSRCSVALESTDATVEALKSVKQAIDQCDEQVKHVVFETDTLEPPSIDNVIRFFLEQEKHELRFTRKARSIPDPDPRRSQARHPLWRYRFGKSIATNQSISEEVTSACAGIAEKAKTIEQSWNLASEVAQRFEAHSVPQLLGVSVLPPAPNNGTASWTWLRRIQLASAQLALLVEQNNGVAIASSRVADVTRGPLDWCIDAALIALAQKATDDRKFAHDVCLIAKDVLQRVPKEGSWSCGAVATAVLHDLES